MFFSNLKKVGYNLTIWVDRDIKKGEPINIEYYGTSRHYCITVQSLLILQVQTRFDIVQAKKVRGKSV